jgi:periplasmic divalent cation tolerance protein
MAVTTVPTVEAARALVRSLVERRVVACGTIVPGAVSIYRWQGAIEEAGEVVVLLKTTVGRWPALREALPALHPYEVPELVAVPIAGGHPPYLDWLSAETGDGSVETA